MDMYIYIAIDISMEHVLDSNGMNFGYYFVVWICSLPDKIFKSWNPRGPEWFTLTAGVVFCRHSVVSGD